VGVVCSGVDYNFGLAVSIVIGVIVNFVASHGYTHFRVVAQLIGGLRCRFYQSPPDNGSAPGDRLMAETVVAVQSVTQCSTNSLNVIGGRTIFRRCFVGYCRIRRPRRFVSLVRGDGIDRDSRGGATGRDDVVVGECECRGGGGGHRQKFTVVGRFQFMVGRLVDSAQRGRIILGHRLARPDAQKCHGRGHYDDRQQFVNDHW